MFAPLIGLLGSAVSAVGTIAAGNAQAAAAEYQRKQAVVAASQERAVSQRKAEGESIRTERFISSQTAAAGLSGGGASDPSVLSQMGEAQGEGALRQAVVRYEGEEKARQWMTEAQALDMQAKNAKQAAMFGAAGTIAGGLGKAWGSTYGASGANSWSTAYG